MTGMKSWSTTPANNVLANTGFTMDEGMAPSSVNDSVRALMADVRAEWAGGTDISASATPAIGASVGAYIKITGPNTITGFDTAAKGIRRRILVAGSPAPTFQHNAASLILPTGENILSVAGDTMTFVCESDISANWRCVEYSGNSVRTTQVGFPATQVPSSNANTLDDYEEGTWTPAIGGTATYTIQTGTYTKVGRLVTAFGSITINLLGSGSTTTVTGLPFAPSSGRAGCVSVFANLAVTPVFLAAQCAATSSVTFPGLTAAGAGSSNLAIFGNAASVQFTVSYEI